VQELVLSFIVYKLKAGVCNISRTFIFSENFYVREMLHTPAFFRGKFTSVEGEVSEQFDVYRIHKGFSMRGLRALVCMFSIQKSNFPKREDATMVKKITGLLLMTCLILAMSAIVFAYEQYVLTGENVRICPAEEIERIMFRNESARAFSDDIGYGMDVLLQRLEDAIINDHPVYIATFNVVVRPDGVVDIVSDDTEDTELARTVFNHHLVTIRGFWFWDGVSWAIQNTTSGVVDIPGVVANLWNAQTLSIDRISTRTDIWPHREFSINLYGFPWHHSTFSMAVFNTAIEDLPLLRLFN